MEKFRKLETSYAHSSYYQVCMLAESVLQERRNRTRAIEMLRRRHLTLTHTQISQGLLEHEPQALKVLLMSEVCAQKRGADAPRDKP